MSPDEPVTTSDDLALGGEIKSTPAHLLMSVKESVVSSDTVQQVAKSGHNKRSSPQPKVYTGVIAKSNELQPEADDLLNLPNPEFRNVAGDVRRRTDQIHRAEPPPSNRPRSTANSQQTSSSRDTRRRRQGISNGGSSDSENDDSNDKRGYGGGSSFVVKGPPRQPVTFGPSESPIQANGTALQAEEQERVQDLRAMRYFEEIWPEIRRLRKTHRDAAQDRKRILVRLARERQSATQAQANSHFLGVLKCFARRLEQQRTDYCDEALYPKIQVDEDKAPANKSRISHDEIRKIIELVEVEFLRRNSRYDQSSRHPPGSVQAHLVHVIREMSRHRHGNQVPVFNVSLQNEATEAAPENLGARRPRDETSVELGSSLVPQVLVDNYIAKIDQNLDSSVARIKDIRENLDEVESMAGMVLNVRERALQPLYHLIESSRPNNPKPPPFDMPPLTTEYVNWVFSGVDPLEIGLSCLKVRAFEEFRSKALWYIKHGAEQVFFLDSMSMVLFKGATAASIKRLSPEDLQMVGCFSGYVLETNHYFGEYWRFEYDLRWDSVFIVNMDEEVLGICISEDDLLCWANDMKDFIEKGDTTNNYSL